MKLSFLFLVLRIANLAWNVRGQVPPSSQGWTSRKDSGSGLYKYYKSTYPQSIYYHQINSYISSLGTLGTFCGGNKVHLATVTSSAENNFIYSNFYLGGTYNLLGGLRNNYYTVFNGQTQFNWVTEEKFQYSNWDNGEPNDSNRNEDCIQMVSTGKWNDAYCFRYWFLILEVECSQLEAENWVARPGTNNYYKSTYPYTRYYTGIESYLTSLGTPCDDDDVTRPHLVTITSADENDFIMNSVPNAKTTRHLAGGTRNDNYVLTNGQTEFRWVTGELFSYKNWRNGEPNDYNGGEDCLEVYNQDGLWNDNNCYKYWYMLLELNCPYVADPWHLKRIPDAVFVAFVDGDKPEIKVPYEVFKDKISMLVATLYEDDCTTAITDNSVTIHSSSGVDLEASTINADVSVYNVLLDINESGIYGSQAWTSEQENSSNPTYQGNIVTCLGVELVLDGDSDTTRESVTFEKTILTFAVTLTSNFEVDNFAVANVEDDSIEENANVSYELSACRCDDSDNCLPDDASPVQPNTAVRICIEPVSTEVLISEVTSMQLFQDTDNDPNTIPELMRTPIADGGIQDELTTKTISNGKALVVTRLVSSLFLTGNSGYISLAGTADLVFAPSQNRKLTERSLHHKSRRLLSEETVSTYFELQVALDTETTVASTDTDNDDTTASAGYSFSIAGVAGGVCAGIIALLIVLVLIRKNKKRNQNQDESKEETEEEIEKTTTIPETSDTTSENENENNTNYVKVDV